MQAQAFRKLRRPFQRRGHLLPAHLQRRSGGVQLLHSPVGNHRRRLHMREEPAVVPVARNQARADAGFQQASRAEAERLRQRKRPVLHQQCRHHQGGPQGHQQEHGQRPPRLPPRGAHQQHQPGRQAQADPHADYIIAEPVGIAARFPVHGRRVPGGDKHPVMQVIGQHRRHQRHGRHQRHQVRPPRDAPAHVQAAHREQRRHQDHRDIVHIPAPAVDIRVVQRQPEPHVLGQQQQEQQPAGGQDIRPRRCGQQAVPHGGKPLQQHARVQRRAQDRQGGVRRRSQRRHAHPEHPAEYQQHREYHRTPPQGSRAHASPSPFIQHSNCIHATPTPFARQV